MVSNNIIIIIIIKSRATGIDLHIDRAFVANKPDVVVTDQAMRRAIRMDITIPHDEKLVKAKKEKEVK